MSERNRNYSLIDANDRDLARATFCLRCNQGFSLTKRRHRCRVCNKAACDKCTAHKVPLPDKGFNKPVRVCWVCLHRRNTKPAESDEAKRKKEAELHRAYIEKLQLVEDDKARLNKSLETEQMERVRMSERLNQGKQELQEVLARLENARSLASRAGDALQKERAQRAQIEAGIAKEKQLRAEENRKAAEILGAEITRASREKERLEREIAHSKEVNVMQKEAIAAEAKAREESAARAGGELSQLAGQHAREMANVMKDFAAEKRKLEAEREAIHKERQETIETTEQRIEQMKLEREKDAEMWQQTLSKQAEKKAESLREALARAEAAETEASVAAQKHATKLAQEVVTLRKQMEDLTAKNSKATNAKKKETMALEAEKQARSELGAVKELLRKCTTEVSDLQQELLEQKQKTQLATQQDSAAGATEKFMLTKQKEGLKEQVVALEKDKMDLNQKLDSAASELAGLKSELARVTEELSQQRLKGASLQEEAGDGDEFVAATVPATSTEEAVADLEAREAALDERELKLLQEQQSQSQYILSMEEALLEAKEELKAMQKREQDKPQGGPGRSPVVLSPEDVENSEDDSDSSSGGDDGDDDNSRHGRSRAKRIVNGSPPLPLPAAAQSAFSGFEFDQDQSQAAQPQPPSTTAGALPDAAAAAADLALAASEASATSCAAAAPSTSPARQADSVLAPVSYRGACLCRTVSYSVRGQPTQSFSCHCRVCRRGHAATSVHALAFTHNQVNVESGIHVLEVWSSENELGNAVDLFFCGSCGSIVLHQNKAERVKLVFPSHLLVPDETDPESSVNFPPPSSFFNCKYQLFPTRGQLELPRYEDAPAVMGGSGALIDAAASLPTPTHSPPSKIKAKASCLCGNVVLEIRGAILASALCHCASCRKTAGASSVHLLALPEGSITIQSGHSSSKCYESSLSADRYFCTACSTSLWMHNREFHVVTMSPAIIQPQSFLKLTQLEATAHINYDSRIMDVSQSDGRPRFSDFPSSLGGSGQQVTWDGAAIAADEAAEPAMPIGHLGMSEPLGLSSVIEPQPATKVAVPKKKSKSKRAALLASATALLSKKKTSPLPPSPAVKSDVSASQPLTQPEDPQAASRAALLASANNLLKKLPNETTDITEESSSSSATSTKAASPVKGKATFGFFNKASAMFSRKVSEK